MERHRPYRSQVLDHLGLIAGMYDELGVGEVIDQATPQHPERRSVPAGHAVKAMVRGGLGFVTQPLYLGPHFFHNQPPSRLLGAAIAPAPLNDDALGRAVDTLYAPGGPELSRLIAATAAQRLGLAPTCAHPGSTRFHVDGRYSSAGEPDAQVIHLPQGYSREQRPARNQVMLALSVEHQAGLPLWRQPLHGHSSDATACGQSISAHIAHRQLTYGMTSLVAESAL
jgi:transposase